VTEVATAASTATGPTVRSTARRLRDPCSSRAGLVLAGVLLGRAGRQQLRRRLDIGRTPRRCPCVAELLTRARRCEVDRVDSVAAVLNAAGQ
jgi:hypothetical protein